MQLQHTAPIDQNKIKVCHVPGLPGGSVRRNPGNGGRILPAGTRVIFFSGSFHPDICNCSRFMIEYLLFIGGYIIFDYMLDKMAGRARFLSSFLLP